MYSVEWRFGWVRIKKSFGTALKMYSSKSRWANLSTYVKLALLSYVVFYEPSWMEQYRQERAERWDRHVVEQPADVQVVGDLPTKDEVKAELEEVKENVADTARRVINTWQR